MKKFKTYRQRGGIVRLISSRTPLADKQIYYFRIQDVIAVCVPKEYRTFAVVHLSSPLGPPLQLFVQRSSEDGHRIAKFVEAIMSAKAAYHRQESLDTP